MALPDAAGLPPRTGMMAHPVRVFSGAVVFVLNCIEVVPERFVGAEPVDYMRAFPADDALQTGTSS
jgi:hypothetical protein